MARLGRFAERVDWRLEEPFLLPAPCFHGGQSISAVGEAFQRLDERERVINADVLDAWFPPAPAVIRSLSAALPWLIRTSPPASCEGMVQAIARARGVPPECIVPGAGSSDLIFRALRHWLSPHSRVLLPDPTYGEYAHVLERVIGCRVDRLTLARADGYCLGASTLRAALRDGKYDLLVLVNPNSPTGRHLPREDLESCLTEAPERTRVWVDETYVDYVGPGQSLEAYASSSRNVVVCKSMSKAYALSGLRVGYLCGPAGLMAQLRAITPPWVVSLPGQMAAGAALGDPEYYARQYEQTATFRRELAADLTSLPGVEVVPGVANFLLVHLPENGPDAAAVVAACQDGGVYLRDASGMGTSMGRHAIRIAVKAREENFRIVTLLGQALQRVQEPDYK
jgi:histidinol-phosphate/aromatic aminotransferase/cobyric acid decarboxylase-like protein